MANSASRAEQSCKLHGASTKLDRLFTTIYKVSWTAADQTRKGRLDAANKMEDYVVFMTKKR